MSFKTAFVKGSRPCVSVSSKNYAAVLLTFIIKNEMKVRDKSNHDKYQDVSSNERQCGLDIDRYAVAIRRVMSQLL